MGDEARVGLFVADDSFLRHIDKKRLVMSNGLLSHEVFKPREGEPSLSFTYQDANLRTQRGLDQYQQDKVLLHGDLPGICKLTFDDLTESLKPPLPPHLEVNDSDKWYGHLHYVTDCPLNESHMEQMAKLASRHGLLRAFVKRQHRRADASS